MALGCVSIFFTGLVIDFEVLSSYCQGCALKKAARHEGKETEEEIKCWREKHDCAKNCMGSSKAMEQDAA